MTFLRPSASLLGLGLTASLASAQIQFQGATSHGLVGFRPDGVASGDFDGDGDQDLAVTSGSPQGVNGPDQVELFVNSGGTFAAGQVIFLGNNVGAAAILARDFDLDGDLDLAVSLKDVGQVRMLVNTGGSFAAGVQVATGGAEPRHMAAGDIDADGDVDLVLSNRDSNNLSLVLNTGAGFSFGGLIATGQEPRHLALADVNGDCLLDLAVAAHDSRRVEVMLGVGGGAFGAATSYPVPGNEKPSGMAAADLDGDGDVDLVSTADNGGFGLFVLLRNTGGGLFAAQTFPSGGSNPDAVALADFDADGDPDLAAADEDANLISLVPNLGGSFGAPALVPVGAHPSGLAAADFDGNGSLDLAAVNRDTNNLSVAVNMAQAGTSIHCEGLANSAGAGARMGSTGSLSIAQNTFRLEVNCAAPGQNGLFFYGAGRTSAPFGAGRLCMNAPFFRLGPPLAADGAGRATRLLGFTSGPPASGPGAIAAGAAWSFQFWYRDPAAGLPGFNTSDALEAVFLP